MGTSSGGHTFVPSGAARAAGDVTVVVSVRKLNAAWARDTGFYISPGGGGAEIAGRRAGFQSFLATGRPIEQSRVELTRNGTAQFTDGRHRFSLLRDQGLERVPISVPRSQAARIKRELG